MKYLFLKNYGLRCYIAVDKQQNYIKLKLKLKPLIGPNGFFPFFDQSGSIILFFYRLVKTDRPFYCCRTAVVESYTNFHLGWLTKTARLAIVIEVVYTNKYKYGSWWVTNATPQNESLRAWICRLLEPRCFVVRLTISPRNRKRPGC